MSVAAGSSWPYERVIAPEPACAHGERHVCRPDRRIHRLCAQWLGWRGGRGDCRLGCRHPDRGPHAAHRARDVARASDAQGSAIPSAIRSDRGQLAAAVPKESQGVAAGHAARRQEAGSRRSSACRSHARCDRRARAPVACVGLHRPGAAPGRLETSWSQRTRGDIESHFRSSLVKREVDQQAGASKRKWPAQARGQSIASTAGWYSTRVADSRSASEPA